MADRQENHDSHRTRFSDSSLYDEVCEDCGARNNTPGVDETVVFSCEEFKRRVLALRSSALQEDAASGNQS